MTRPPLSVHSGRYTDPDEEFFEERDREFEEEFHERESADRVAEHGPVVHRSPSPARRHAAWMREDPAELNRAADEWESLGYRAYAEFLRARALGKSVPPVRRPW